jgi:hypothetical protein
MLGSPCHSVAKLRQYPLKEILTQPDLLNQFVGSFSSGISEFREPPSGVEKVEGNPCFHFRHPHYFSPPVPNDWCRRLSLRASDSSPQDGCDSEARALTRLPKSLPAIGSCRASKSIISLAMTLPFPSFSCTNGVPRYFARSADVLR